MKVIALKKGYYNHKRINEGDEFVVLKPEDFSSKWMKAVGGEEMVVEKKSKKKVSIEEPPAGGDSEDVI